MPWLYYVSFLHERKLEKMKWGYSWCLYSAMLPCWLDHSAPVTETKWEKIKWINQNILLTHRCRKIYWKYGLSSESCSFCPFAISSHMYKYALYSLAQSLHSLHPSMSWIWAHTGGHHPIKKSCCGIKGQKPEPFSCRPVKVVLTSWKEYVLRPESGSWVLFLHISTDTQEYTRHRSHSTVKLLSPGCIYAGVITKAWWQVADRWQIDGLCPWVWTAPAWPVHQIYNNTVGEWHRGVTHTDSTAKDTGVLEVSSETRWLLYTRH